MTIQFVARSCACSEPQLDTKELAPGASTTMRILFKTQMRSGEIAFLDSDSNCRQITYILLL
jgi:hypothetical protein